MTREANTKTISVSIHLYVHNTWSRNMHRYKGAYIKILNNGQVVIGVIHNKMSV